MNQNVVPIENKTITLPEPGYPMVTRMISNPLFHDQKEEMVWIVSQPHPLVPDMKVMRMFVDRGGVEVYSISSDGRSGTRNLIPMGCVRLIEEAMPLDVFIEEVAAAEGDDGDEPEPEPADTSPSPNGQQVAPS